MSHSTQMDDCIKHCEQCHHECVSLVPYCLDIGGPHAALEHIRLLMDCAGICHVSADFMLRGSPFHTTLCGSCARVCEACAEDCERFPNDATMARCAEACRRCAESCRAMSMAA